MIQSTVTRQTSGQFCKFIIDKFIFRSLGVTFYELSVLEHSFYVDNKPIRKVLNDISEKPFIDLPNNYFSQHYNSLVKRFNSSIFEFFFY